MGRKIRLLWTQETDTEVYFRIQVHMDSSQYAAIGNNNNNFFRDTIQFHEIFWSPLVKVFQKKLISFFSILRFRI